MGYKIFILCLRQVLNNWRMAVRLSWFWLLVLIGVFAGAVVLMVSIGGFNMTGISPGIQSGKPGSISILSFLLVFVVIFGTALISSSIVAIGWHRFVLREETPEKIYVLHRDWPLGRYIWSGVKIGLIVFLLMILVMFVIYFLATRLMYSGSFMYLGSFMSSSAIGNMTFIDILIGMMISQLVANTVIVWVLLRLGIVLPATAVGKSLSLRDSFQLTGTIAGPLFITAFFVVLFQFIPAILSFLLISFVGSGTFLTTLVMPLVTLVFSWFSFFIGFGVLTVIYGHLVENKPI